MASFPWDEMLGVQQAILDALNDSEEERESLVEAFWGSETAAEKYVGAVAAESTAKIVKALEEVKELHDEMKETQGEMAKAVSGCATSLNRLERILESVMSGIHDTRRSIGFWGPIVAFLLLLGASDELLYLLGRLGRMFG